MRAPISVVIPTLNAEAALTLCLQGLYEGVQAGIIREVIVVDAGSDDGTVTLADDAGAVIMKARASRGLQLREGCAAARGEWILALHADSLLQEGWAQVAQDHMKNISTAGFFKLRFGGGGAMAAVVAGWANFRASVLGLPFGDQGLLISRSLYDKMGGFPDIPLMEDVAMARVLGRHKVALDCQITTSSDKYREQGWIRRGARNLSLQLRYFAGASPEKLAQSYRGR